MGKKDFFRIVKTQSGKLFEKALCNTKSLLIIKVNCKQEAGKFSEAIPYCLFVSFEVAEGFDVDLYTNVTAKIRQRVQIPNN